MKTVSGESESINQTLVEKSDGGKKEEEEDLPSPASDIKAKSC
jgi:hypothetical protein